MVHGRCDVVIQIMAFWRWNICIPDGWTSGISTGRLAASFTGSHRPLIIGAIDNQVAVCEVVASVSVRWWFCLLLCRWLTEVCWIEGEIISHGDIVDSQISAEWGWDVVVFSPTLIIFILSCEFYFECIFQRGHEVTKEYFWKIL